MNEGKRFVKSFNGELDRKIGVLRTPFLCLIEGPNDSGKSIIAQQYTYGALNLGFKVLYITTETGTKALINSMEQITLNVKYFFLTGQFEVFELHVRNLEWNMELASKFLDVIIKAMRKLSKFDIYVIDSLTYLVTYADERDILNFFTEARNIVDDLGKSIFVTIHPYAFEQDMLIRMRSICDVHFILSIKEIGDRIVKLLQVPKLKGAEKPSSITLSFDVDPAFGIKILPFSQARA